MIENIRAPFINMNDPALSYIRFPLAICVYRRFSTLSVVYNRTCSTWADEREELQSACSFMILNLQRIIRQEKTGFIYKLQSSTSENEKENLFFFSCQWWLLVFVVCFSACWLSVPSVRSKCSRIDVISILVRNVFSVFQQIRLFFSIIPMIKHDFRYQMFRLSVFNFLSNLQ